MEYEIKIASPDEIVNVVLKILKSDNFRQSLKENVAKDFNIDLARKENNDFVEYVAYQIKQVFGEKESLMNCLVKKYKESLEDVKQEVLGELDNIFGESLKNKKICVSLWPCDMCPYTKNGFYFSVQKEFPTEVFLRTCIHEIIHLYWWQVWEQISNEDVEFKNINYPSASWLLSEMAVQIIVQNTKFIKKIVGKQKVAHTYFYDMEIGNKLVLDSLNELFHKSVSVKNFMLEAFYYVKKHKDEIISKCN